MTGDRRPAAATAAALLLLATLALCAAPAAAQCGSTGPYYGAVLATTPWGWWRLAETSGTTAQECSGNSRGTGTYTGTGYVVGAGGRGASYSAATVAPTFTGGSTMAYVQLPTIPAASSGGVPFHQAYSLEAWVYPTDVSGGAQRIFDLLPTSGSPNNLIYLYYGNGDAFLKWTQYSGGTHIGDIDTSNPLTVNTWNHIVVTVAWSGTTYTLKTYINNVAGSATGSVGTAPTDVARTQNVLGASSYFSSDSKLAGQFGEAAIYSYVLSASQVAAHYAATAAYYSPPPPSPPASVVITTAAAAASTRMALVTAQAAKVKAALRAGSVSKLTARKAASAIVKLKVKALFHL